MRSDVLPTSEDSLMLDSLHQYGWAIPTGVETTADMLRIARTLGRPVPAPTGELVKVLSPTNQDLSRRHTFSASHGQAEFPFHTDTAFWPRPSRYLVMRVVGDRRRPTVILPFRTLMAALGREARRAVERSVWRTRRYCGGIYCSMRFTDGGTSGWRFDPQIMVPANASALLAMDEVKRAISESEDRTRCRGKTRVAS
jgi:hypothetical protein